MACSVKGSSFFFFLFSFDVDYSGKDSPLVTEFVSGVAEKMDNESLRGEMDVGS